MRAIHEPQIALFGGECISAGYRGRRSGSQISRQASRGMALVVGALVLGCVTAATAVTIHRSAVPARNISAGANLSVPAGSLHLASAVW